MTEQDLSTLLHDRLPLLEPPLVLTATDVITRGRRSRRNRAGLALGVLAVSAAALTAAAVSGVADRDDPDSTQVATDQGVEALDGLLVDIAAREYMPHLGALPVAEVSATDEQGSPVPVDGANLAGIGVLYQLGGEHQVTLTLHAADETAITDCTEWNSAGTARSCDVETRPDGGTVMSAVLALGPAPADEPATAEGLPTLLDEEALAAADPATLTWSHLVVVRTPDGEFTGAYEILPAPTYQAALSAWQLPESALLAAATDPALTSQDLPG